MGDEPTTGARARRGAMVAGLCVFVTTLLLLAGCGGSGEDADTTSSISEDDLKAAVQDAKQKEQLKALKDQIDDLEAGGDSADSSTTDPGSSTAPDLRSSSGETGFTTYTDPAAGWTAEIPTGGGWSQPAQSQPTPGALFETQLTGPVGLFLVIDYTPNEAPAFGGAPVDSRTATSSANFGSVEKIVFQGNSNFPLCETGLCVDYLVPSGSGGYAILTGGSGNLGEAEALGERVLATLRG